MSQDFNIKCVEIWYTYLKLLCTGFFPLKTEIAPYLNGFPLNTKLMQMMNEKCFNKIFLFFSRTFPKLFPLLFTTSFKLLLYASKESRQLWLLSTKDILPNGLICEISFSNLVFWDFKDFFRGLKKLKGFPSFLDPKRTLIISATINFLRKWSISKAHLSLPSRLLFQNLQVREFPRGKWRLQSEELHQAKPRTNQSYSS